MGYTCGLCESEEIANRKDRATLQELARQTTNRLASFPQDQGIDQIDKVPELRLGQFQAQGDQVVDQNRGVRYDVGCHVGASSAVM
ncbi:MAG: hypothetical protein AUJ92_17025 [Armatimonadetes bacterium CG2_30_59_28]|nr:MAG: hypothetical protein AUJ92_17025 [Armatimonadetes bacterium CG2_30_59_28]